MLQDVRGVPLSTNDPDAASAFERSITSLACHRANLGLQIARALRHDPALSLSVDRCGWRMRVSFVGSACRINSIACS